MTIVIDDSRVINKLEASHSDNASHHLRSSHVIVQTTGLKFSSIRVINKPAHFATTFLTFKNF